MENMRKNPDPTLKVFYRGTCISLEGHLSHAIRKF